MSRPRKHKAVAKALKLMAEGLSIRAAADRCKIAPSTITRALKRDRG